MPIISPSAARPRKSIETPPTTKRWFAALAVAIFALAPLAPMVVGGFWPHSHDDLRYFPLFDGFRDAMAHGIL
jgi:hypothetical protein